MGFVEKTNLISGAIFLAASLICTNLQYPFFSYIFIYCGVHAHMLQHIDYGE